MMQQASNCAFSDSCSIDEIQGCIAGIVQVQERCAADMTSGAVCDNISETADILARLREKVKNGTKAETRSFIAKRQIEFENLVMASVDSENGLSSSASLTAPIKPAYLAIASLYAFWIISFHSDVSVIPFTAQEWWWAVRDGYLNDMVMQYANHGGWSIAGFDDVIRSTPFTAEEWWWSIRDGYTLDVISENMKNGGYLVGTSDVDDIRPLAFTADEWWNAAKDGYLATMISHFSRNGGL